MKVAVIGATGFVGQNLVEELSNRGHEVIAIARHAATLEGKANVTAKAADVNDVPALAAALNGAEVVVSAFNAGWTNPNLYNDFLKGSKDIQQAVKDAGVNRLIVIGGAGSLFIDGKQLVDGPDFPADYKAGATAARDYLNLIKEEKDLNWSFFSPAIEMHPGITTGRTGNYRLSLENPVFNEEGRSILSVQDLAVAIADEVENNQHSQQRFTAAY
ncbi:NAD(P)-dependent oxidoreductase [Pedobacter sp. Hv1]|uniref:NAD(P)-dependent oxidoreductase n=1 Tax=Pedobacter sp. Hv1 TaxID=1740090 RepID=UPI0006D899DE|nr:NAD(P)H-binding protein [Pedobacter sp. Hv1]KQC01663.1 histidine kinase [Pedobacter sp. Hv1]